MIIKNSVKSLFGLALLLFLLFYVGLENVFNYIITADIYPLLLAVLITPLLIFIHLIRWKLLIDLTKKGISLYDVSRIYLVGMFLGTLTPSKLGEFFKYHYLSKHGIPKGTALSVSVLDRIFDLIIVSVVSVVGIFFLLKIIPPETPSIFILSMFGIPLLLVLFLIFNRRVFMKISSFFVGKAIILKNILRIKKEIEKERLLNDLFSPFNTLKNNYKTFCVIILFSLLLWIIIAFQAKMLLVSLGETIDIGYALTMVSIVSVVTLIPVTISGIGTREATFTFLLSLSGILADKAIAFSLLMFFINIMIPGIVGGITYIMSPRR